MAKTSEITEMILYDIWSEDIMKKCKDRNINNPASKRGLPEIHATNSIWTGCVANNNRVTYEMYLLLNNFIVIRYRGIRVIINIIRFVRWYP